MNHDNAGDGMGGRAVEMAAMDDLQGDLDTILSGHLENLRSIPGLRIQPRGAIRMYNPGGNLMIVAQHGLSPAWLSPGSDDPFAVAAAPDAPAGHPFVLPLSNNRKALGEVLIMLDPDWSPSAAQVKILQDFSRTLSWQVSHHLMYETLQIREVELEDAQTQALRRLGAAAEFRDNETGMHVMRMTGIAMAIARTIGLPERQRELLRIAAPMHDVGKIGIADAILLKPGKLTDDEFLVMKTHTAIGNRLLEGSEPILQAAREIACCHHENWDGSGYPHGLKGEEIPILARICSIADVFDALTSKRPYKEAWSVEAALDWIRGEAGKKFDPGVMEPFMKALPEILRIRELYREDVINPNQALNLSGSVRRDGRWVTWDESLRIGIDVIDEHHRYLFDLTDDLISAIAEAQGAGTLVRVMNALVQYTQVHFQAEERMMEHYGYAGIENQRKQHRQFSVKLKELYDQMHDNPLIAQIEVARYLQVWLVDHIRHEDTGLRSLIS